MTKPRALGCAGLFFDQDFAFVVLGGPSGDFS